MPVTSAPNDLWQVVVHQTLEEQSCLNVLNFRTATPIDDFELRIIIALMQCFAAFAVQTPSGFRYQEIRWKQTAPVLGVEHITPWQGNAGAEATGEAEPSFVSAVVSMRTALGGRSHRGRIYIPGIPEAAVAGSRFDKDGPYWLALVQLLTCIATKFINIGDPAPANAALLGVYSRKLGGATFPYQGVGFTPAVSLIPVDLVGTTRSRKIGRGQ